MTYAQGLDLNHVAYTMTARLISRANGVLAIAVAEVMKPQASILMHYIGLLSVVKLDRNDFAFASTTSNVQSISVVLSPL